MEIFSARRLTNMGLVAAIYVAATMLCSSLAYGQVQFRISEVRNYLQLFMIKGNCKPVPHIIFNFKYILMK